MMKRYLLQFFIVYLFGNFLWTSASASRENPSHRRSKLSKTFPHAAVVSQNGHCSRMGNEVLKTNGSAIDAAIMTVLCLGIICFQSTGIGGGGHMTIYKRSTKTVEVIDFKETAPSGVKDDDFKKPWREGQYFVDPKLVRGAQSIGVPGLLKGFELAHKRHGKKPWKYLFESATKLAERENYMASYYLENLYDDLAKYKKTDFKNFREFLASSRDGNNFKNPALAKTFRTIAAAGNAEPFYNGVLSQTIVSDIQNSHGAVTLEDLKNYRAVLREPVEIHLGDKKLYSTPPPAGGTILSSILNILNGYDFSEQKRNDNLDERAMVYHKMIEAFKWSYANIDVLGDPEFPTKNKARDSFFKETNRSKYEMQTVNKNIKDLLSTEYGDFIRSAISVNQTYDIKHYHPDGLVGKVQGTTHVTVLAENGDAVSITSSINSFFGSFVFSPKLGILFNNKMKDFREYGLISGSINPDTTTNIILPGKRPPSLMSPSIIVDKDNNVVMVIGAAGGSRIPSVMAQVIAKYLWLGNDMESSINQPRFHHQLYPNIVFVEKDIPYQVRIKLQELGHKISEKIELVAHYPMESLAKINAIIVERNKHLNTQYITGIVDFRGETGIEGY